MLVAFRDLLWFQIVRFLYFQPGWMGRLGADSGRRTGAQAGTTSAFVKLGNGRSISSLRRIWSLGALGEGSGWDLRVCPAAPPPPAFGNLIVNLIVIFIVNLIVEPCRESYRWTLSWALLWLWFYYKKKSSLGHARQMLGASQILGTTILKNNNSLEHDRQMLAASKNMEAVSGFQSCGAIP